MAVKLIIFKISEFVVVQSSGILNYIQSFIFKSRIDIFQTQFFLVSVAFSNLGMLYECTADNSITLES